MVPGKRLLEVSCRSRVVPDNVLSRFLLGYAAWFVQLGFFSLGIGPGWWLGVARLLLAPLLLVATLFPWVAEKHSRKNTVTMMRLWGMHHLKAMQLTPLCIYPFVQLTFCAIDFLRREIS